MTIMKKMTDKDIANFLNEKARIARDSDMFGKRVVCVTTKKCFDRVIDGAKFYHTHDSSICKCCKGELHSSGKLEDGTHLVWMYYNDYIEKFGESTLLFVDGASA